MYSTSMSSSVHSDYAFAVFAIVWSVFAIASLAASAHAVVVVGAVFGLLSTAPLAYLALVGKRSTRALWAISAGTAFVNVIPAIVVLALLLVNAMPSSNGTSRAEQQDSAAPTLPTVSDAKTRMLYAWFASAQLVVSLVFACRQQLVAIRDNAGTMRRMVATSHDTGGGYTTSASPFHQRHRSSSEAAGWSRNPSRIHTHQRQIQFGPPPPPPPPPRPTPLSSGREVRSGDGGGDTGKDESDGGPGHARVGSNQSYNSAGGNRMRRKKKHRFDSHGSHTSFDNSHASTSRSPRPSQKHSRIGSGGGGSGGGGVQMINFADVNTSAVTSHGDVTKDAADNGTRRDADMGDGGDGDGDGGGKRKGNWCCYGDVADDDHDPYRRLPAQLPWYMMPLRLCCACRVCRYPLTQAVCVSVVLVLLFWVCWAVAHGALLLAAAQHTAVVLEQVRVSDLCQRTLLVQLEASVELPLDGMDVVVTMTDVTVDVVTDGQTTPDASNVDETSGTLAMLGVFRASPAMKMPAETTATTTAPVPVPAASTDSMWEIKSGTTNVALDVAVDIVESRRLSYLVGRVVDSARLKAEAAAAALKAKLQQQSNKRTRGQRRRPPSPSPPPPPPPPPTPVHLTITLTAHLPAAVLWFPFAKRLVINKTIFLNEDKSAAASADESTKRTTQRRHPGAVDDDEQKLVALRMVELDGTPDTKARTGFNAHVFADLHLGALLDAKDEDADAAAPKSRHSLKSFGLEVWPLPPLHVPVFDAAPTRADRVELVDVDIDAIPHIVYPRRYPGWRLTKTPAPVPVGVGIALPMFDAMQATPTRLSAIQAIITGFLNKEAFGFSVGGGRAHDDDVKAQATMKLPKTAAAQCLVQSLVDDLPYSTFVHDPALAAAAAAAAAARKNSADDFVFDFDDKGDDDGQDLFTGADDDPRDARQRQAPPVQLSLVELLSLRRAPLPTPLPAFPAYDPNVLSHSLLYGYSLSLGVYAELVNNLPFRVYGKLPTIYINLNVEGKAVGFIEVKVSVPAASPAAAQATTDAVDDDDTVPSSLPPLFPELQLSTHVTVDRAVNVVEALAPTAKKRPSMTADGATLSEAAAAAAANARSFIKKSVSLSGRPGKNVLSSLIPFIKMSSLGGGGGDGDGDGDDAGPTPTEADAGPVFFGDVTVAVKEEKAAAVKNITWNLTVPVPTRRYAALPVGEMTIGAMTVDLLQMDPARKMPPFRLGVLSISAIRVLGAEKDAASVSAGAAATMSAEFQPVTAEFVLMLAGGTPRTPPTGGDATASAAAPGSATATLDARYADATYLPRLLNQALHMYDARAVDPTDTTDTRILLEFVGSITNANSNGQISVHQQFPLLTPKDVHKTKKDRVKTVVFNKRNRAGNLVCGVDGLVGECLYPNACAAPRTSEPRVDDEDFNTCPLFDADSVSPGSSGGGAALQCCYSQRDNSVKKLVIHGATKDGGDIQVPCVFLVGTLCAQDVSKLKPFQVAGQIVFKLPFPLPAKSLTVSWTGVEVEGSCCFHRSVGRFFIESVQYVHAENALHIEWQASVTNMVTVEQAITDLLQQRRDLNVFINGVSTRNLLSMLISQIEVPIRVPLKKETDTVVIAPPPTEQNPVKHGGNYVKFVYFIHKSTPTSATIRLQLNVLNPIGLELDLGEALVRVKYKGRLFAMAKLKMTLPQGRSLFETDIKLVGAPPGAPAESSCALWSEFSGAFKGTPFCVGNTVISHILASFGAGEGVPFAGVPLTLEVALKNPAGKRYGFLFDALLFETKSGTSFERDRSDVHSVTLGRGAPRNQQSLVETKRKEKANKLSLVREQRISDFDFGKLASALFKGSIKLHIDLRIGLPFELPVTLRSIVTDVLLDDIDGKPKTKGLFSDSPALPPDHNLQMAKVRFPEKGDANLKLGVSNEGAWVEGIEVKVGLGDALSLLGRLKDEVFAPKKRICLRLHRSIVTAVLQAPGAAVSNGLPISIVADRRLSMFKKDSCFLYDNPKDPLYFNPRCRIKVDQTTMRDGAPLVQSKYVVDGGHGASAPVCNAGCADIIVSATSQRHPYLLVAQPVRLLDTWQFDVTYRLAPDPASYFAVVLSGLEPTVTSMWKRAPRHLNMLSFVHQGAKFYVVSGEDAPTDPTAPKTEPGKTPNFGGRLGGRKPDFDPIVSGDVGRAHTLSLYFVYHIRTLYIRLDSQLIAVYPDFNLASLAEVDASPSGRGFGHIGFSSPLGGPQKSATISRWSWKVPKIATAKCRIVEHSETTSLAGLMGIITLDARDACGHPRWSSSAPVSTTTPFVTTAPTSLPSSLRTLTLVPIVGGGTSVSAAFYKDLMNGYYQFKYTASAPGAYYVLAGDAAKSRLGVVRVEPMSLQVRRTYYDDTTGLLKEPLQHL